MSDMPLFQGVIPPFMINDEYGNSLAFIETGANDGSVLVKINGNPTGKMIKGTYYKHEKEKDTYRKLNAWSVPLNVFNYMDELVVESEKATYRIHRLDVNMSNARTHTNAQGLKETKIYIPKKDFHVVMKNPFYQRQLEAVGQSWYFALEGVLNGPEMRTIRERITEDLKKGYTVLPKKEHIFNAYKLTPLDQVRVVIIGQDPYPHEHAHGLAFSSLEETTPASLKNIFKELEEDTRKLILSNNNNLERWAKQGVFLLNTVLTVQGGYANSHKGIGWEAITGKTIEILSESPQPIVWVLWGNQAANAYKKYKKANSSPTHHLVITAPHPSPLSAHTGFFGHKPFSRINEFLVRNNQSPIDWLKGNEDIWKTN